MNLWDIIGFDGLKAEGYRKETSDNGETTLFLDCIPTDTRRPCCPECGSRNVYSDGYRKRAIKDATIQENKVIVNVTVGKYNCRDCNKTFQQEIPEFAEKGSNISNRLKELVAREAVINTFASASTKYDVSNTSARIYFVQWTNKLDKERNEVIKAPRILGIDEAHLANFMRGVYTDSEGAILCGITPSRDSEAVAEFIKSLDGYENIEAVTMDMYLGYRSTVYDVIGKNVSIVVDRFHVIQDLNKHVVKARRDIVHRAGNPKLGDNANLMKMNLENLNPKQKEQLMSHFAKIPELSILYALKESFRTIYNCKTKEEALECYGRWCTAIPDKIKDLDASPKDRKKDRFDEIRTFKKTVETWKREIFNYFDFRATNAGTEAINGLIKIVNRNGRGYSYDILRRKIQYGLKANSFPKEPVFANKKKPSKHTETDYGFMSYVSPFSFDFSIDETEEIDRTNDNLTPNIEDLYYALLDEEININGSEDE